MFILSSVVLYISTKFVHGEDISMMEESVKFDCSRLPITYCCTTRVRTTCKVQCSTIRCDSGFYKRDKKLKQLVVGPQTIYKNGLNDGDTADLHSGIQMKRTNRKPSPQNLSKKMYLPAPTSSDENESLVNMSSEDISVMPSVTATVSSFNCGLEPSCITEPQVLITTEQPINTFIPVREGLQRKHWELRSFNIIHHLIPTLNWPNNHNFIGSNSNMAELKKEQCGVAPEFSPCISISQANIQFEQCCRNKFLPSSCQHSCKYVKESEVSTNIDVSVCTILHIIPIVQCASNERDNSECCRYKQITAKSAPQCEIFCRSGQEITRLGLEHLLCRKVMDEIIACHLSGLRS
ncbi:DB module family protein [Acanthocheilonema viteae]